MGGQICPQTEPAYVFRTVQAPDALAADRLVSDKLVWELGKRPGTVLEASREAKNARTASGGQMDGAGVGSVAARCLAPKGREGVDLSQRWQG